MPLRHRQLPNSPAAKAIEDMNGHMKPLPTALQMRDDAGMDPPTYEGWIKALLNAVEFNIDLVVSTDAGPETVWDWFPTIRAMAFLVGATLAPQKGGLGPNDVEKTRRLQSLVTTRLMALATYVYVSKTLSVVVTLKEDEAENARSPLLPMWEALRRVVAEVGNWMHSAIMHRRIDVSVVFLKVLRLPVITFFQQAIRIVHLSKYLQGDVLAVAETIALESRWTRVQNKHAPTPLGISTSIDLLSSGLREQVDSIPEYDITNWTLIDRALLVFTVALAAVQVEQGKTSPPDPIGTMTEMLKRLRDDVLESHGKIHSGCSTLQQPLTGRVYPPISTGTQYPEEGSCICGDFKRDPGERAQPHPRTTAPGDSKASSITSASTSTRPVVAAGTGKAGSVLGAKPIVKRGGPVATAPGASFALPDPSAPRSTPLLPKDPPPPSLTSDAPPALPAVSSSLDRSLSAGAAASSSSTVLVSNLLAVQDSSSLTAQGMSVAPVSFSKLSSISVRGWGLNTRSTCRRLRTWSRQLRRRLPLHRSPLGSP